MGAADSSKLLASIPGLVKKQDATALVAIRDHEDKAVRKAVGKALHTLKSKGVEIPDAAAKEWTVGDALESMRGELTAVAVVDSTTVPGAMRFMLSEPDPRTGGTLFAGAIGPTDRILDFSAFRQTDGQRTRMIRDWERKVGDRRVPPQWMRERIVFARDATIAAGFSVPRTLDEALPRLGPAPAVRPPSFLTGLDEHPKFDPEADIESLLRKATVPSWPPLLDLESTLAKAAEIHGDKPQPTEDAARVELLMKSIEGDQTVREALAGTLAQGLSDAAIHFWLEGDAEAARKLMDMVAAMQGPEPEKLPWVARLLGYQVASLLRVVSQQQKQQQQQQERQARARRPA